jgi:hypothetical protein
MKLKEKYGGWAVITGASSGIGEQFAKRFAEEGMNLILIARRKDRLDKLADELITKNKIDVIPVQLDLTEDKFIDRLKGYTDNLDIGILVNNAGVGSTGDFVNVNLENEIKMVKLNCLAPTILTHHIVPKMTNRKRSAIIFLGSVVSFQPTPYMATYSATKVFNTFMGEALWWELKKYNIDVLAINPGGTETEFQRIADAKTGPIPRKAEDVVNTTLKALGKKPSVVDGNFNKIIAVSSKFGSRKFVVSSAGKIANNLYRKRRS